MDPRQTEQFRRGLAENGLVEGRTISIGYLWSEGSIERLQQLAADLAQRDRRRRPVGPQSMRALLAVKSRPDRLRNPRRSSAIGPVAVSSVQGWAGPVADG